MWESLFFKGWLIGFSIAMPVGPIGMLCIHNSLTRGMLFGMMTGLGAALADATFAALAAFGVGLFVNALNENFLVLEALGALVLSYLGIHTFFSYRATPGSPDLYERSSYREMVKAYLLTLTNPLTFLAFAAVYAAVGICCGEETYRTLFLLTCGVLLGASSWWLMLSFGVSLIGQRWRIQPSQWLNRISGTIILTFGLLTFFDLLARVLN